MEQAPELVLVPAITDMTRAEIEEHIEAKRARRMLAAITYHEGVNARLERRDTVLNRRIQQQYDMLAKEISTLDKALEKVDKRIAAITNLENEQGLVRDQIVPLGADEAASAGDDD